MRIQHNIMAMNAYRNYSTNTSAMQKNLERLSSGYKINRAGDDAAGLAISEKMRAQITGLEVASKNAKDGISLVQTAEGALTEVHDMLNRMVELATQSANGTYAGETDRIQLQKEVDQLCLEINRIADSANFNGIKLLDGSMDATIRTTMNKVAESFGIADWVGSNELNASSPVGTGTIWHTDPKDAEATKFAVQLNNSTVATKDGVKITLGGTTLELTGEEIKQGASAEEIVTALIDKYGEEGVTFKGADGETDVKFNISAGNDGTSIIFEQVDAPKTAGEVVGGNMAITYEGIGGGVAADKTERLNVTKPGVKTEGTGNLKAKTAAHTVTWGSIDDEAKNALNEILGDGVKLKAKVKYGSNGNNPDEETIASGELDISDLLEKLGDKYTVTVTGTGTLTSNEAKTVWTATGSAPDFTLTIKDAESADTVVTLALGAISADISGANGTDNAEYTANIILSAGNNTRMNTKPAVSVEDNGKLTKSGTDLFAFDAGFTDEDLINALNEILGKDGQSISVWYEKLEGNTVGATTELHAELSQALKDAGYYLSTTDDGVANTTVATGKLDEETNKVVTGNKNGDGNDDALYLYDKDNKLVGKITLNNNAGTDITADKTVITLKQTSFNAEDKVTNTSAVETNVGITFVAAAVGDGDTKSNLDGIDFSTGSTTYKLHDGDKFTIKINGKDYDIIVKGGGGLSKDDLASGKYLDLSDLGTTKGSPTSTELKTALQTALTNQLKAEAKEAANGTEDYVEITGLTLDANGTNKNRFDLTYNTQKFVYVGDQTADDGDDDGDGSGAVSGGKDPNRNTVTITAGHTASDGRLASTLLTKEDFAGLKDGSQLKIGDVIYIFAIGQDSKFLEGANVVRLDDLEEEDANLYEEAMKRLTVAAGDNEMFSVGFDENGNVTFTEKKTYEGDADLTTQEGIAEQFGFYTDGMETTGASGSSLTLQIGDTADSYNQLRVNIQDCHTTALGIDGIDISDQDSAGAAVNVIKEAINYVSDVRGTLGATQNRLDHTINNLSVMTENIQDAESTIRDTDIAEEMMAYTKNNILIQAAQAMLAQANQVPQGVLQLLQ